ncbi:MAG: hypothetical protein E7170_03375 [Firmicutes bacterium]|nr:hypothetical protein [Bacillota bacterium]
MFKSEASLFLSANNNVNSAKTLINECKKLIVDFNLDDNINCENLKNNINNCDIDTLVEKIENTKESLMKLDQEFSNEYMQLLQEFFQTSLIDTSNMTDDEKMEYNIQLDSYARDYDKTLLCILEKYEESGMLTDEMNQQLEYQRNAVMQYDIKDKMSVLEPTSEEYINLFMQYAEYDKKLINLNPSLTEEEKRKYLEEYDIQYKQNLTALQQAKDVKLKNEKLEQELKELYTSKEENNGLFHPFVESEIDEAILDKKIELGIATEDEIEYKNMNGWDRFWVNTGTFAASTYTGLFNITEGIGDAFVMLGSAIYICDKDWACEYVSRDLSGELYQGIQLSANMNSWSAYGTWHNAGEMFGETVGKVGMTFAAPWAAGTLYGLDSMGQMAETGLNNGDEYWAAFGKSFVSGVGGFVEGFGFSKLNFGIRNFVSTNALKTIGNSALSGIKNFGATLVSPGGLKIVGGNILNLAKTKAKTIPTMLGKAGLATITEADALIETGCVLANNIIECVQSKEWDFEKMIKETGTILAINYVMNFATTLAFDIDVTEKMFDSDPTLKMFDSDPTLKMFDNGNSNTNPKKIKRTSKEFDTYDEFKVANSEVRKNWEAGLTKRERELIHNYISESDYSSYVTMNGIARGTCIDAKAGTVTFYHAVGKSPRVYTFAEYYENFGETVQSLYERTLKECAELDAALRKCRLLQDTIITRGMDADALQRFGVDIYNDSAETIMAKLGDTYSDAGFMSSTPVAGGGFTYKDINLIMDCPAGSACADFATFNPLEEEVLFPMGQQFNVDNVVKKDGKIYIYMTLKGEI